MIGECKEDNRMQSRSDSFDSEQENFSSLFRDILVSSSLDDKC